MGYVPSDMTAAMRTNVKAIFMVGLGEKEAAFGDWKKIATIMPSESDKEEYNWLGAAPPMEEWKDTRKMSGLRPFSYTLTNLHFANGIEINRDALEDNKLGQIPFRVRQLIEEYLNKRLDLVFSALDDGETGACFDAGNFFSDSRTVGDSGTIDNILSGNYSDSAAEIRAGLAAAYVAMAGFKNDWGKPLGLIPDLIVCSPLMVLAIQDAIFTPSVQGTPRPEAALVKNGIVPSPWIDADTDDWFVLCTSREVKPLIYQNRKDPELTSLDKPDDHDAFHKNTLSYGVDARFVVGYGDPRTAVLIHNT